MPYYFYDDSPDRRPLWLFLVGLAAGALLVGVAWGGIWLYGSQDEDSREGRDSQEAASRVESPATPSPETSPAPPSPEASQAAEPDPCHELSQQQDAVIRAGEGALAQWEVHIGAMNQLVTGAITLDQATAFWDDTRVGARRNLDRFRAAQRELESGPFQCPEAGAEQGQGKKHGCATAVAARTPALRALDTTLDTWGVHVRHMEMLRKGQMSAARAAQMWLDSWRAGTRDVRTYHALERKSRHQHC